MVDRYGTTCWICEQTIDLMLTRPDPLSFSIDHVVPLAAAGTHTYDNVAPAHLICNMRKGVRLLPAASGGDA